MSVKSAVNDRNNTHSASELGSSITSTPSIAFDPTTPPTLTQHHRTLVSSLCDSERPRHFLFPGDGQSSLVISPGDVPLNRTKKLQCAGEVCVPPEKFISLHIEPFQRSRKVACKDFDASLKIKTDLLYIVTPCHRYVIIHAVSSCFTFVSSSQPQESPVTMVMVVKVLDETGYYGLNVSYRTNVSGLITPYGFDGFHGLFGNVVAVGELNLPSRHNVMLSFPHFDIAKTPGCSEAYVYLIRNSLPQPQEMWMYCGAKQLPPQIYKVPIMIGFISRIKFSASAKAHTGIKIRFSFHAESEVAEKVHTSDPTIPVFNCSVRFYPKFQQHLECNLEAECVHGEDEATCPYFRGACEPGFLNAESKCYKYVKTRMVMTWYNAHSLCLRKGLTLASFTTSQQREIFRQNILTFAPVAFNLFIGLRTSDPSLPSMYRDVWQWSSGIAAYYVHTEGKQTFKPVCAFTNALDRNKISATMCGFYEYIHYIFCETMLVTHNRSHDLFISHVEKGAGTESSRLVTCAEGHITHDFLSCDPFSRCAAVDGMTSCVTETSIQRSAEKRDVEIIMYVCNSQTQTIHYTQVCDHRAQCLDSSDETFCIHPACADKRCRNRQCVTTAQWCDGMAHCTDGSDEECPQFVTKTTRSSNVSAAGFHAVLFDGHGKYRYVPQGSEFRVCPPSHFLCADRELCLPVYLRCNGVYDCSDREDEDNCDDVTCPGYFRCRGTDVCVHTADVCDGVFQCPQQDDELLCQMACPENCLCQGSAFVCSQRFPVHAYSGLRYLDASGSGLAPDKLFHNCYLIRLHLSSCRLNDLPEFEFSNLKYLDLGNNSLTSISMKVFLKLPNLYFLSVSRNPIVMSIGTKSKTVLGKVHFLDLSQTALKYFDSETFRLFPNMKNLNMSHTMLKIISSNGFGNLTYIESLDLRGTELQEYPLKMLQSLSSLQTVFTDVYKLCCPDVLPGWFNAKHCHTSPNEIASCDDLLRSDIYRIFLWTFCSLSLLGNVGSFAARCYIQKGKPQTSFNVFIAHLNVADFFMGLFLAVVGSADQVYRGAYLWRDKQWTTGTGCKIAGFFCLLSSEMSAFIICFITLDRFLVMRFPLSQVRFRHASAAVVCGSSWLVGIALAALPLLPVTAHWDFYSQTGICIPLPITRKKFNGQFYSFGIMIVLNFVLFLLIAVGQLLVYMSIMDNSMNTDHKNSRETTVARRLLTVVVSDFLCWFPIGVLGLMASNGVSIPGEVNVAMAILALPLNSALNPFLYTFNVLMEKRQKASEALLLIKIKDRYTEKEIFTDKREVALADIKQWVQDNVISSSDMKFDISVRNAQAR